MSLDFARRHGQNPKSGDLLFPGRRLLGKGFASSCTIQRRQSMLWCSQQAAL